MVIIMGNNHIGTINKKGMIIKNRLGKYRIINIGAPSENNIRTLNIITAPPTSAQFLTNCLYVSARAKYKVTFLTPVRSYLGIEKRS